LWNEIEKNAMAFGKRWRGATSEKQDGQGFMEGLLRVFSTQDARTVGTFEEKTKIESSTKWIDYLWRGKIAVEMKSKGENLTDALEQLREYMHSLAPEDVPDLWVVSDFENIWLSRRSTNDMWKFKTKDLRKHVRKFADLAGYETERDRGDGLVLDSKAAEKMAKLHDGLKSFGYDGHNLELYLVRLLFCMFADDTNIFAKDSLYRYVEQTKEDGSDLSFHIFQLFEILNTPDDVRAKRPHLKALYDNFRYINGTLFENPLPPAEFNQKMRSLLMDCIDFDWSSISPAIFGAMFQGVMDDKQRRELGAHYTDEDNINKLINPLFMDELWAEFERSKTSEQALDAFHNKIANLKFLDPACGCGNFLIVAYIALRKLELAILEMKTNVHQMRLDAAQMLKVNITQFYGIELENFPCQIAQVGMWLADHQMNMKVWDMFAIPHYNLPLKQTATIIHANALRIDWETITCKGGNLPPEKVDYILGNPPFLGARIMNAQQKEDMNHIFGKVKGIGNLDYVTAWYKKAADYMESTRIKTALVSTNSISQGEQPAILWKPLMKRGIYINFGVPTFRWDNEAKGKAAVHCVIIGFSYIKTEPNVNPYLLEAPSVFIESSKKPLSDVPDLIFGNMPNDGGNFIIKADEYEEFLSAEPKSKNFIRKYLGAEEFINNTERYCLWLIGATPQDLRSMPMVMERVQNVRTLRQTSTREATRKKANTPTLFAEIRQPSTEYVIIPRVSSENRRYIPMGFLPSEVIASDATLIIPNATLYHFGILTSNVHMAWTRAVCGRLKSDYRYSKDIVYNNFPWPQADEKQQAEITTLAQAALDARANYPTSSLADLYDPLTMPPDLLRAHQNLDKAVMKLYGFPTKNFTEADCVAALMQLYQNLTAK